MLSQAAVLALRHSIPEAVPIAEKAAHLGEVARIRLSLQSRVMPLPLTLVAESLFTTAFRVSTAGQENCLLYQTHGTNSLVSAPPS